MKRSFLLRFSVGLVLLTAAGAAVVPDRYMVELNSVPAAVRVMGLGRGVDLVAMERFRTDVRSEQAAMKVAIQQAGGQVLDSVDVVANAIFVRIPAGDAATLARLPGVKNVYPVRLFQPVMDHAVVVHKITDVWKQIGLDKAGAGMRIAIVDTGIENTHAAFQDPSLPALHGYPQSDTQADKAFTNQKVIVARSYVYLLNADPDSSARDHIGHGTSVAMAAAGVLNAGPLATIRGVAPMAYLGNYKVFGSPGVNDSASEDAIIKAIEDAVTDGMDVINLSLGDPVGVVFADDLQDIAIHNATSLGHIVVVAAGNAGPDPQTVGSPASSPTAITAGGSVNNRRFSANVTVGAVGYQSIAGTGPAPAKPVDATMIDITKVDSDGLACSALPANSLTGDVALILRGICNFSVKLANAQTAGAVGAVVYTDQARPEAITMDVQGASLPAMMVSYNDGTSIRKQLAAESTVSVAMDFALQAFSVDPDQLASFSSAGPNVDGSIKPDLVAVGQYVYTAAETSDAKGELYSANGYAFVDGTSYSSPIVAGSAALIKAARPGLTVAQYRSLLINSAAPAFLEPGVAASVQQTGAGLLDVSAALRASGTIAPTSLSFGTGTGEAKQSTSLTITNVSTAPETFHISVTQGDASSGNGPGALSGQPEVTVSTNTLTLNPRGTGAVTVTMHGSGLSPGAYEGFIHVRGTNSGVEQRVPYWYGVGSHGPARITILDSTASGSPNAFVPDAVLFRVTDAAGINVPGFEPKATVIDGGGFVIGVGNQGSVNPGVFSLTVRLGPAAGANDFQIQAGPLTRTVTITGQ
jgi:minor extracellular serine protease Vpr